MDERNKKLKPIVISPQAKDDLINILNYLLIEWNQDVVDEFLLKLEAFYYIISISPSIFGFYNKSKNIRKYALTKHNVVFYRNKRKVIEIVTVFDVRQDVNKLKKLLN